MIYYDRLTIIKVAIILMIEFNLKLVQLKQVKGAELMSSYQKIFWWLKFI